MSDERNELPDKAVKEACDRMLALVQSMPRDHDYDRLVMATGALIGCASNPSASCAAFARSMSWLLAGTGQTVEVQVRDDANGKIVVFEGATGQLRHFEIGEDGEPYEVGATSETLQ